MRWKFEQFEFNQSTNVLSSTTGDSLLEPKTAALLCYFLKNQQKNISRDELIEHVWNGQIVSENAINRVVVRLRKALGDDEKIKTYIVTVPKTGYRFVADASSLHGTPTENEPRWYEQHRVLLLSMLLLLLIAGLWVQNREQAPTGSGTANVSPVVRLSGQQFSGVMANQNDYVVYSHIRTGGATLYWLESQESTPVAISPVTGTAKNAYWSSDDQYLIYQYTDNTVCEFHLVPFEKGRPLAPQTIYECHSSSDSSFGFAADNKQLYFTERQNEFAPYTLYALDLVQGDKTRISQPVAIGLGNYRIDMSPTTGALLLLSSELPGQTSAFSLNVEASTYKKIHEFDYSVRYAIWGHEADTIVHMGEHPSYQLVETNVSSKSFQTLVTDSRRITEPRRANNGKDYLFRSFLVNRDIAINGTIETDINSSVRDYLPSFSRDGNKLAFISKRAGYSQVWVKDYESEALFPIEVKDKGHNYKGLAWSEDDTKLVANTDSGIILINIATREASPTIKFALQTYAVAWAGKDKLSYSHFVDGRWDHYEFDPETNVSTPYDKNWAFSLENQSETLHVDQQLNFYKASGGKIDTTPCGQPIYRESLTFRLDEDRLFCLAYAEDNTPSLLRFNGQYFEHHTTLPDTTSYGYSVSNDKVAVSVISSASSDIMRTNFEE